MNLTQAKKYLKRTEKRGYVSYHSGLVMEEVPITWGGNTTGSVYGINIDGDGGLHADGRHLFGCPQIIWDEETAERIFPARSKMEHTKKATE
jgi:hypothetical protein